MNSEVSLLHRSPTAALLDYRCHEAPGGLSPLEVVTQFEIDYTRRGLFGYCRGTRNHEIDVTSVLVKNTGSEHRVEHGREVRDACTVIQVSQSLVEEWDLDSSFEYSVLPATPQIDHLHAQILSAYGETGLPAAGLKIDSLILQFIEQVFHGLQPGREFAQSPSARERELYLETIERAKEYIVRNFDQDLCLHQIAKHAHSSEFHFSRLFKRLTSRTPHQYLLDVRLNHAALLLRNTSLPVTEICFASGFNSLPHFIATFTVRNGKSPAKFRKEK